MNQSPDVRRREIATRDLLFRALLKWRIILLIAVLSAAAFLFVKMKRPAPAKNAAAGGASFDEAMEAYREERSSLEELIERSRDLLAKKRRTPSPPLPPAGLTWKRYPGSSALIRPSSRSSSVRIPPSFPHRLTPPTPMPPAAPPTPRAGRSRSREDAFFSDATASRMRAARR